MYIRAANNPVVMLTTAASSSSWNGFIEYGSSKHGLTPAGGSNAGSMGAGIGPTFPDMASQAN